MITKLYESIVQILKNNFKFFLILLILLLVCTFELPYYIDAPGGLIDVSDRITIENSYESQGSFNLAYVTEMKATLPTLLLSIFNKDWDVLKKEEVIASNETAELMNYRSHLLLEEANQNAIYIGYLKAGKEVSVENRKVYVTYIDEEAKTDLQIGDQILKINNQIITSKQDVLDVTSQYGKDDTLEFLVEHDGTQIKRKATLYSSEKRNIIGIVLSELKDVKTNQQIDFHFKASESGPSGGFMTALAIYDDLIEEDITHGLKIVGTGTIDELGNVGIIGGIEYKIKGAIKNKADLFFVPKDNYEEALKVVKEENLDIKLIVISNIDEAIEYLNNL